MIRWALLGALLSATACGGAIAPSPAAEVSDACVETRRTYSDRETVPRTSGNVDSVAVACPEGERFVSGSCDVTAGGVVVDEGRAGTGWGCSVVASRDDVSLTTSVTCAAPCGEPIDAAPPPRQDAAAWMWGGCAYVACEDPVLHPFCLPPDAGVDPVFPLSAGGCTILCDTSDKIDLCLKTFGGRCTLSAFGDVCTPPNQ